MTTWYVEYRSHEIRLFHFDKGKEWSIMHSADDVEAYLRGSTYVEDLWAQHGPGIRAWLKNRKSLARLEEGRRWLELYNG